MFNTLPKLKYSGSSRKRTPSGREKGVLDWIWPLTRMNLIRSLGNGYIRMIHNSANSDDCGHDMKKKTTTTTLRGG